jgi:ATP-binding cassette subfamily F protein 3
VRSADLRKLRAKVADLETKIADNETQQSNIGAQLATAAQQADVESLSALEQKLLDLQQHHQLLLSTWENTALDLEHLEQQLLD